MLSDVPRTTKKDRPQSVIRTIVAKNVRTLRDRKWPELSSDTARNAALARASGIAPSQIHRILRCELGTSIDYLEMLASALDVRPQDLVTPYYQGSAEDMEDAGATGKFRRRVS